MNKDELLPGVYPGIQIEDYHQLPGVSNSMLSKLAQSPAHCKSYAEGDLDTDTDSTDDGQMLHTAFLEPALFDKKYRTDPGLNRNSNAWKALVAENPGIIFLKEKKLHDLERALDNIHRDHNAMALRSNAEIEQTFVWIDPETEVLCRCRPDMTTMISGFGIVPADLKKTESASPINFSFACERYHYANQAAFYSDGVAAVTGEAVKSFAFICSELSPPWLCQTYYCAPEMVEFGRHEVRRLLRVYAECLSSDRWPGYSRWAKDWDGREKWMQIDLPLRAYRRMNNE